MMLSGRADREAKAQRDRTVGFPFKCLDMGRVQSRMLGSRGPEVNSEMRR